MLKKIMSWMLPYFVYNLIVLLLIASYFLIPKGADIAWLFVWGFYFPYIGFIVYILGFTFGYFTQKRSMTQSVMLQLLLALIVFTTTASVLSVYILTMMETFFELAFIPAFGSALFFFAGEIYSRYKKNRVCNKNTTVRS